MKSYSKNELTEAEHQQRIEAAKQPRRRVGGGDSTTITLTLPNDLLEKLPPQALIRNRKIREILSQVL